jgi:multidrug efflux system membrane fusion protein
VPSNALLFRAEGPRAAVVVAGSKVQLRPVAIGRDFGNTVEILSGLEQSDAVVVSPSDSLESGEAVRVVQGSKQE